MSGLLSGLSGQQNADAVLTSAFTSGRLSHAYLFAGPAGTGRLTAALALASAFMCGGGGPGCGSCRHCRRIARFEHPDVRVSFPVMGSTKPEECAALLTRRAADGTTPLAVPGNSAIGIDAVREIQMRLAMKPFEGDRRVEIILGVDRMRQEAANALLKTLEEPPPGTLLLMTCERTSAVLPTVRSRAHLVRFGRVPPADIAALLERVAGTAPGDARRIAAAADGSVGAALELAREGDILGGAVADLAGMLAAPRPEGLVQASRELSRTLGASGVSALASRMAALFHDAARVESGLPPLSYPEAEIPGRGRSGRALARVCSLFVLCERRLKANTSPAAALAAAVTGAWEALREAGG